jgi:hypothetical protein
MNQRIARDSSGRGDDERHGKAQNRRAHHREQGDQQAIGGGSRAERSLALVACAENPERVKNQLLANGWFKPVEIFLGLP